MTVVRPPITGDVMQDSWMDQVTQLINSGFFARDTVLISQGQAGAQGAAGINGLDGFSAATLYLFQRQSNNLPDTAPTDLTTNLVYDYINNILFDPNNRENADGELIQTWNGWTPFIPEDPNNLNQYIWVITVNVADRENTESIPFTSWSARTLLVAPAVNYEMESFGFDFIRANQLNVDLGVRIYRTVGEVSNEITDLLKTSDTSNGSTWVTWTKHSVNAGLTGAAVWVSGNPYTEGDIVRFDFSPQGVSEAQMYEFRAVRDTSGTDDPLTSNDWTITDESVNKMNDDIWNFTDGINSGLDITVDAADVITQTEFRAELSDSTPLPYPTT